MTNHQSDKIFLFILILFIGVKVYCVYTMIANDARVK
jgi:hypothetical protein